MAFIVRRLVSKNKRRLQEDGFDLDLTYITPCIIAMGFPAADVLKSLYRNRMPDVRRLLQKRHGDQYKVYNLCIEQGYGYNAADLCCPVERLPLYDGQPAPLYMVHRMCQDAASWLSAAKGNVVAIHCKAGKGRTGTLVCALLLYLAKYQPDLLPEQLLPRPAPGPFPTSQDVAAALRHYDVTRTHNGRGLTLPSQIACVHRYAGMLRLPEDQQHRLLQGPAPVAVHKVSIIGLPIGTLSSFTLGIWERPTGCYEAGLVCLVHGGTGNFSLGACLGSPAARTTSATQQPHTAAMQTPATQAGTALHRSPEGSGQGQAQSSQPQAATSQGCGQAGLGKGQAWETPDTECCGTRWPSRWGQLPGTRPVLHPLVSVDPLQHSLTLTFPSTLPTTTAALSCHAPGGRRESTRSPDSVTVIAEGAPATTADSSKVLPQEQAMQSEGGKIGDRSEGVSQGPVQGVEQGAVLEGDIKLQLLKGHVNIKGPSPYMHRAAQFFTWLSTRQLDSCQDEKGPQQEGADGARSGGAGGSVVVVQRQLDKLCSALKSRGPDQITVQMHFTQLYREPLQ